MPPALRGMWAAGLEEVKVMRGLVWCFGFRVCQLDSKRSFIQINSSGRSPQQSS